MNHFDCIGFSFPDAEAFQDKLATLANSTEPIPTPWGSLRVWEDPSGAQVIFALRRPDQIECTKPHYAGQSRVTTRFRSIVRDEECSHCDRVSLEIVDADGEMCFPMVFELDDIATVRELLPKPGSPLSLSVAAFAEEITVWDDAEAYAQAGKDVTHNMAIESFIPSGTFVDKGTPEARALFTGRIDSCETKVNRETGRPYWWASVATFGMTADVLIPYDAVGGLREGNIVQGVHWFVARVVSGLQERRPGALSRLLRR